MDIDEIISKLENKISYTNNNWSGELFGNKGVIVLRDCDVMYFSMKHRKVDTYEGLKNLVDSLKYICEKYKKKKMEDK